MAGKQPREGSLEAPTRHPIDWRSSEFTNPEALDKELERVFDICHGCRRCFSLCNAFPTLFDAVDESDTGEVDGMSKDSYAEVVDHCYLCDMCYMSKCPYVPPHEWNVDFPHLMLRAKVAKHEKRGATFREKVLSSPASVGKLAGIPVVAQTVNAVNKSRVGRKLLSQVLGVDDQAPVPSYASRPARKRLQQQIDRDVGEPEAVNGTQGQVVVFTTCYGNYNQPHIVEDLVAVFQHNGIRTRFASREQCCGMPKLELGDLESVARFKEENAPALMQWIEEGWDVVAPIPSCVLMFKQELPLLFPEDESVKRIAERIFDPFEYLMLRHKVGKLETEFSDSLGKISYQVPCHLRVQNIGLKTRDALKLVPDTDIDVIERCSGHDGTYAVKTEFADTARKIARPVARRVDGGEFDHFTSDCPMAADHIAKVSESATPTHPITLLRKAYGL